MYRSIGIEMGNGPRIGFMAQPCLGLTGLVSSMRALYFDCYI